MDEVRYAQVKSNIKYSGIPTNLDKEEFTKEQIKELTELLTNRSKESLDTIKKLKEKK